MWNCEGLEKRNGCGREATWGQNGRERRGKDRLRITGRCLVEQTDCDEKPRENASQDDLEGFTLIVGDEK